MAKPIPRKSKDDWFRAALALLDEEGINGVRVERLARELGVAKSGFYWHFEDREELLSSLLTYWSEEFTQVIARNSQLRELPPAERLRQTMEMIVDHDLARYDLALRSWAAHDPMAARAFRRVYKMRLDFVRTCFEELGFRDDELEMRTRVFVCCHSWEQVAFRDTKKGYRRLMHRRLRLLTRK